MRHNTQYLSGWTSLRLWKVQRGILWSAGLDSLKTDRLTAHIPVEFKPVQRDSLPQLLTAAGQMDPIPQQALVKRLDLGRQCYAAWVDGSLAAYGWLTRGREWVGEFERSLNVQDGEAYIWDCATLPAYRRQRLFSSLLGYVAEQLSREGLQRLWIIAVITGPAMNRGIAKGGFAPILNLTYFHFYNKRVLLTIPAPNTPSHMILAARRLLKSDDERAIGPLLIGNSNPPQPPDTHLTLS
jgi:GNAT superfamily N-acetyltransferase